MSVVCGACGSKNRENAKFCIGCAQRLPGFAPTGPSALDATLSTRAPLAPAGGGRAWRRDDPLALLPAETPAFWLRLGLAGVAMGLTFIGWYLYVTRGVATPAFVGEPRAAVSAADRKPAAGEDRAQTAMVAPNAGPAQTPSAPEPAPAPARAAAPAPAKAPTAQAPAPAPTPAPAAAAPTGPAPAPAATTRSASLAPQERRRSEPARAERPPRLPDWATNDDAQPAPPATAATMPWIRPPGWTRDDPGTPAARAPVPVTAPVPVVAPSRAQARDGGPPIAPGPGPVYNYSSPGNPVPAGDGGPPVVPGPGPLFTAPRTATVAADDAGPPIARGPGPVYNWTSTRER